MPVLPLRHSISAGSTSVFKRLLIADKVIVHEKDALAPAEGVQAVQLGDDLGGALEARPVPKQSGHITEITAKRAAA